MKRIRSFFLSVAWMVAASASAAGQPDFVLSAGQAVTVSCGSAEADVVHTALDLLRRDCQAVFSSEMETLAEGGHIVVGTVGVREEWEGAETDWSVLDGKQQAFLLAVVPDGRLLIAGSDKRSTAYGIMELSQLIGVSPWVWWGDVVPAPKTSFTLPAGYAIVRSPSVTYRGIFINDEDWGMSPWSWQTYEPTSVAGQMGPKTHARIFELLLRLRANLFWPAMHECSMPFYFTEGNREKADKYGIFIGTSHCEPMMRNTNGEWARDGAGEYDYVNNRANVVSFWEERVKEVAGSDNIYTLGMRGVHDGAMNGANTTEEQKTALAGVLQDQRALLARYVDADVTKVPQVFIPYKEVLDVYQAGLQVPDDVTLMWCDDNYGYVRHFPTAEERARAGGNGIYYHVSYWGRPHDYLWLGTFHPSLLFQQMSSAWQRGIRKMWILNVGDLKPAEYQIELFLDMAWDMDAVTREGATAHLQHFLEREMGAEAAARLLPVMQEHYRLAFIRKPEFMGNTRTEETDPAYKIVCDLPWSEEEIRARLAACRHLAEEAEQLETLVPACRKDAYFQLVKYPVQGAAWLNEKLLVAQLARHGKADWADSDAAYDRIEALTAVYNQGKWNRIMDIRPRELPVFDRVARTTVAESLPAGRRPLHAWNGADYVEGTAEPVEGLGYEGKAVVMEKGGKLAFDFAGVSTDSVDVEIGLLPTHPVEGDRLRFSVAMDGADARVVAYETYGRSEEWKVNVLRNRAVRRLRLPLARGTSHRLVLTAVDEGVVLDRVELYDPLEESNTPR